MAQSDQSYSAGMMAVKQALPEELAAAHWRQTQSLQALAERQDAELAALRAEVERQGEAIRVIDGWLVGRELRAADPATYVPWIGEPHNALLAALAAPVPPAGAPLPGPVADAVMRRAGPLSPLPPEVEAAEAVIRKASDAGLFDAKPETARALAAWARAQQPALGDDVREVMREAADRLGTWQRYRGRIEAARASDLALAARLRELAGECGGGFATIPGWQAGEP